MGLFDGLRARLRTQSRQEAEYACLCEARSRNDLEMREREIDAGRFRHLPRR